MILEIKFYFYIIWDSAKTAPEGQEIGSSDRIDYCSVVLTCSGSECCSAFFSRAAYCGQTKLFCSLCYVWHSIFSMLFLKSF